jgi:hypothetical protein
MVISSIVLVGMVFSAVMKVRIRLQHADVRMLPVQVIQRKRRDYLDPSSRDNMGRLNSDLADIHDIMKKNIQEASLTEKEHDKGAARPAIPDAF